MDRLRALMRLHPDLLSNQPVFEDLIEQLDDRQADKLASLLTTFIFSLERSEASDAPQPTVH